MEQKDIDLLLREIKEHYGEDDDLTRRYRLYSQVDADKALAQMQKRIAKPTVEVPFWHRHRYALAAALTLFIVGGLFWYWQYTRVTPPVISEEIQSAMARCEQNGFHEAEVEKVTIKGLEVSGERLEVSGERSSTQGLEGATDISLTSHHSPLTSKQTDNTLADLLQARRVTTHQNKEYWLTLPDGSVLHLNYNTRVVYPEQFAGDSRDIYLDGEAYLMVAKDKRHPFIVHTPTGDIRVLGTEFCVNTSDADNSRTRVVLVNGRICVTMKGGEPHDMQPGDMALLYPDRTTPVLSQVDVEPYIAWNTGKFSFEDCALEKLMSVVSKWYGYHVEYDSEDTRQLTFTGELDKYSSVEPVLHAISKTMNLRIEMAKGNIFISKH